ncbi:CBS domain-containing protein [Streptomyces sp. bgisy100]|uniref:CBS domain-containing protein n=1 Tax=Streptomyces sp. bgisy100 TaxID=3413783 RepID=UPI003D75C6B8
MRHSRIGSLMVTDVVAVGPRTPFKKVAKLLAEHRISGVPVVDDDERVLGVISESDLLARQAGNPASQPHDPAAWPRWLRHLTGFRRTAAGIKERAVTAEELMSAPAIAVHAADTIAEGARTMASHRVERLPVLDEEDRLVGIVTRRDLLEVFLRPDADIRREIVDEVFVQAMWLAPDTVDVHVLDGVVTLRGRMELRSDTEIAVRMVRQLDGVVMVVDELVSRIDDTRRRPVERTPQGIAGSPSAPS